MTPQENHQDGEENEAQNHEIPHAENEPSIPAKAQPHKFSPPIHGNKFSGANNF